jgi:hypothetical protein
LPHFIKGLGNVEKCSGTLLLRFVGFVDPFDDTVELFYCGMSLPEAKLVSGDRLLEAISEKIRFKRSFGRLWILQGEG